MKHAFLMIAHCIMVAITYAQNVGIGTAPSGFLLEVNGRARLRPGNANQSGMLFQNPGFESTIIGMFLNDELMFYSPGPNRLLSMNVNTGFIGFGNIIPTASLDINGGFRWRGAAPQANAVLMSKDNDGNATWQRPITFGVSGSSDLADMTFNTTNTWNRIYFNTIADYNQGFAWQTVNSLFEAPVKGVYRFSLHLHHATSQIGSEVRLIRRRAGINYIVATQQYISFSDDGIRITNSTPMDLNLELLMEPQDQLWAELNPGFIYPAKILGAKRFCSFSGRLLFLQ